MGFCMFPCQNYLARFNGSNLSLAFLRDSRSTPSCRAVASSRRGKCQFAGAKIVNFFENSKSNDNYFSDLSKNNHYNIYYMNAREKLCA